MLLAELAEASGVSPASIKYYRREGLLPAGGRVTATRQDYGPRHLERLALIQVLREVADAPIARIARLTTILDDPGRSLLDALEAAQQLSLGLPERQEVGARDRTEHPSIVPLLDRLGWPEADTAPRRALDDLLHSLDHWGVPTDIEVLHRYAVPMAEIARADVTSTRDLSGDEDDSTVSDDVQVMRAVAGAIAFDRLVRLLRALGHSSYSILDAQDRGPGSGQARGAR